MANGTNPLWSSLSSQARVDKIMDVVKAATTDPNFRAKCLDENTRKATIEGKALVRFDSDLVLQVYPNKAEAEKQIVLLLPEVPIGGGTVQNYWLCTYVDYIPV